MEINIRILKDTAGTYGLKVNQEKSKILQVRGTERPRKVGGLEVVDRLKYLGVIVGGTGRDIFKYERESLVEKAQKKAAMIKTYIKKSYDITSVGKAVWKLQAIPALMFGKQVVTLSKKLIDKIQKIENNMYRYLIGVGGTAPVATLRGEVGASSIESRVMETILNFTRDTLQGRLLNVKSYIEHDLETGKGRWSKTVQARTENQI